MARGRTQFEKLSQRNGHWKKVLDAKPDWVLIQFGHNDQPGKGPERETDPATTYRDYLKIYVTAFREIGATPILVSSVTRRHFDTDGKVQSTLTPWAIAAKEVAAEMKVPFIDLHTASVDFHNKIGPEKSTDLQPQAGRPHPFQSKRCRSNGQPHCGASSPSLPHPRPAFEGVTRAVQ